MANWRNRRQNINRVSLGVTLEHDRGDYRAAQLDALAWLVSELRTRYDLPAEAVVAWSSAERTRRGRPGDFPWQQFRRK